MVSPTGWGGLSLGRGGYSEGGGKERRRSTRGEKRHPAPRDAEEAGLGTERHRSHDTGTTGCATCHRAQQSRNMAANVLGMTMSERQPFSPYFCPVKTRYMLPLFQSFPKDPQILKDSLFYSLICKLIFFQDLEFRRVTDYGYTATRVAHHKHII